MTVKSRFVVDTSRGCGSVLGHLPSAVLWASKLQTRAEELQLCGRDLALMDDLKRAERVRPVELDGLTVC